MKGKSDRQIGAILRAIAESGLSSDNDYRLAVDKLDGLTVGERQYVLDRSPFRSVSLPVFFRELSAHSRSTELSVATMASSLYFGMISGLISAYLSTELLTAHESVRSDHVFPDLERYSSFIDDVATSQAERHLLLVLHPLSLENATELLSTVRTSGIETLSKAAARLESDLLGL